MSPAAAAPTSSLPSTNLRHDWTRAEIEALFALPFLVAGFALVHGVVGIRHWGRGPLIVLYIAWLLAWELVTGVLLLLAVVDSWLDFRARLRNRQS